MPVPIAIIVCEGDIETIAHISEALENKLPVIIMKGSGKAADLVFDFLQNEEVLRKKASVLFGIRFDDTKYNELEKHLATIKKKKDLIGVFDLDQDDPLMLSNIVGEAVVSCWSMENILQRDINDVGMTKPQGMRPKTAIPHSNTNGSTIKGSSLAWKLLRRNSVNPEENAINQILGGFKEGSRPYVLNPKYSTPTSLPLYFYFGYQLLQESGHMEECGPILLLEALKANRCDYVRVLLDQGVNLKMENLPELYEQTVSCQDCTFKDEDCLHMQWILKMMFFTMLIMYSAFVLTSISTKYYVQDIARVFEYYVYFWGAGDFIEELISCFGCLEARGRSHRGYYSRMKRYLYDFWNVVDLLSYALLISALFVRHFYIDETFTIARRMFGLSLLVMYLRFLEVFLIHRKMGPTLIMIKEMLKDLLGFLFIALFVVLGVGIYYHANLWPDHQTIWSGDWTNWRIWTIIYYPYWQLYAELNLEHLDGSDQSDCTNITSVWESDTSINRCPQEDWTVQAVAAIYLLFSNLLLVNLVIAMFSFTSERVQENSEKLWRFERYTVINDYDWRIPSPINLVFLPYRFFCCPTRDDCCLQGCRGICCKDAVKNEKKFKADNEAYQKNFQKITALKIHNKI